MNPERFNAALLRHKYEYFTGVPCSHLGGLIEALGSRYLPAPNEGAGLAMAAGAALAGKKAVVLLQNSGLGNLINPLTSLALPFTVPVLLVVSMRGWPDPAADEVQHSLMGPASIGILEACGVPYWILGPDASHVDEILAKADAALSGGMSAAILVPRGTIEHPAIERRDSADWTTHHAVEALAKHLGNCAVIASTGFISRELYSTFDRAANFYMQGSMGHALAIGIGVASVMPARRVLVIEGDGAALMHLGSMAAAGGMGLSNITHVVIDNQAYESTGGQASVSGAVGWAGLAVSLGYMSGELCLSEKDVDEAMTRTLQKAGPHLIAIRANIGLVEAPPRATKALSATHMAARFTSDLTRHVE